jgi:hypothetical protein
LPGMTKEHNKNSVRVAGLKTQIFMRHPRYEAEC